MLLGLGDHDDCLELGENSLLATRLLSRISASPSALSPGDPTYNLPLGLRIDDVLDPGALRQALARLVGRREVLRAQERREARSRTLGTVRRRTAVS